MSLYQYHSYSSSPVYNINHIINISPTAAKLKLTYNRPIWQSSSGTGHLAVDNVSATCYKSNNKNSPFWAVTLDDDYMVNNVKLEMKPGS